MKRATCSPASACRLAEWLYEDGIVERRAALVEADRIVEARIERDGEGPRVGAIVAARLVEGGKGALVALDWPGEPVATLAGAPSDLSTGARLTVEITRTALRERGRDKPARARVADAGAAAGDGPDLRARIAATGLRVTELRATDADRIEAAGWSELIDHIRAGHWPFAGGALWVDVTPAMTLIDSTFMAVVISSMKGKDVPDEYYDAYNDYIARSTQACGMGSAM